MATKKASTPVDEKLDKVDVDLFEILAAIDKKDYGYYDRLTPEQQKKVAMFILVHWTSAIKASGDLQRYYLGSVEYHTNKYFLNETVSKHPRLQWLMLCAASPGMGKQFHQWIPHISNKVSLLIEPANTSDIKKYFSKIYPKADPGDISEFSKEYVAEHKRKCHLAALYPQMKLADIEVLGQVVTETQLAQYEKDRGN